MARPRKSVDVLEVLRLRLAGFSWPCIAARLSLGLGTVYRAYRTAIDSLQPFQNPKTAKIQRHGDMNGTARGHVHSSSSPTATATPAATGQGIELGRIENKELNQ